MKRKFLCLTLGLVLATLSTGRAMGAVVNPSFEADGNIQLLLFYLTGWTDTVAAPFGGDISDLNYHTNGTHGARLFTTTVGTFSAGTDARLSQAVDLTGVSQILFDAQLDTVASTWQSFAEATFYIDSTKKWSSQTEGTYADRTIDVTGLSGLHTLSFRLQIISAGSGDGVSNHFEFDNVRTSSVPEPAGLGLLLAAGLAILRRPAKKMPRDRR